MRYWITNGHLYQDGKAIKPEVFNPDHIRTLKLFQGVQDNARNIGIPVNFSVDKYSLMRKGVVRIDYSFKCICDYLVKDHAEYFYDTRESRQPDEFYINDYSDHLTHDEKICRYCGNTWEFYYIDKTLKAILQ